MPDAAHGGAVVLYPWDVLLDTADATSMEDVLGQTFIFDDVDPADRVTKLSGHKVTYMVVRNESGITLPRGRLLVWKAAERFKSVDGYTTTTAAECAGVVSHFYTNGVAANHIFAMAVKGPQLCLSDLSGGTNTNFSEGAYLAAITGATSQSTTSGRFEEVDAAVTEAVLRDRILNCIGRAMSANTTAQTNRLTRVNLNLLN